MLIFTEMSNEELEAYKNERCNEIRRSYDDLKGSLNQVMLINDDKERIRLIYDIMEDVNKLMYEHTDTLDRYLLAYENNKHLTNTITKLKHEKES
jgi:predicted Zn-dependent peptidase